MGQQDDLGLCIQLIDGVDDALLFAARIDNGGPASGLAAKNAAILLKGRHRHDGTLNHEGESRSRLKRAPAYHSPGPVRDRDPAARSEEHTAELQSRGHSV